MPQPVRFKAAIAEVVTHAEGLRTLHLTPDRPVPPFRPGQFLHLAIDPYDPASHWPESRIFSIASSPTNRRRLSVTFSAAGRFTRRMLELKAGDEVWLKLPYGDFVVEAADQAPSVVIAGGTGITPFVPLLAGDHPPAGPLWVLYGARTAALLIYRDVIERACMRWTHIRSTHFVEDLPSSSSEPGITQGRLTATAALDAAQFLGDIGRTVFYLSGPPSMLVAFKGDLAARGVAMPRIRIDAWGVL